MQKKHWKSGSVDEFEADWKDALQNQDYRYCSIPSFNSPRQSELFEWIKAEQISSMLKRSKIISGKTLEFGCGAAGISLYLANLGYQANICDISMHALQIAQMNRRINAPNVDYESIVQANGMQLPYTSNSFDVVLSNGLLEHFEILPLNQLLSETIRVLKPGGLYMADIIPGPKRMNIRTLAILANFLSSGAYHTLKGRWQALSQLPDKYFNYYYESSLSASEWKEILSQHSLREIKVSVCRPFPPLALPVKAERLYTNFIRRSIKFHQKFDETNNWFTHRWGWMYLVEAYKI